MTGAAPSCSRETPLLGLQEAIHVDERALSAEVLQDAGSEGGVLHVLRVLSALDQCTGGEKIVMRASNSRANTAPKPQ